MTSRDCASGTVSPDCITNSCGHMSRCDELALHRTRKLLIDPWYYQNDVTLMINRRRNRPCDAEIGNESV